MRWLQNPSETICDPACGTGGFFLISHDYIVNHNPDHDEGAKRSLLKEDDLSGLGTCPEYSQTLCHEYDASWDRR